MSIHHPHITTPSPPTIKNNSKTPSASLNIDSNYWKKYNNTGVLIFLWGYTIFSWTLTLVLIWKRNPTFFSQKKHSFAFPLLAIPYIYIIIGICIDFQILVPQKQKSKLPPIWNACLFLPEKKDSWIAKYNFNCSYNHDLQTIEDSNNIANRSYYLVYVLLLLMLVAQKSEGFTLLNNNILLSFSSAALLLIFITSGLMTLNTHGLFSVWVLQYMKSILCMTGICIIMIIYIYFNQ